MKRKQNTDIELAIRELRAAATGTDVSLLEGIRALHLAYDLGRIAGLREAAQELAISDGRPLSVMHPVREVTIKEIRKLANREARKLRRKP